MPRVTASVGYGDVSHGKPRSACNCPLAYAFNRVLPYGIRVAVARGELTVLGVGPEPRPASVVIPLPVWVAQIVDAYDAGGMFPMVSVAIEFPDI